MQLIILCLLPALAYASIDVNIRVASNENDAYVQLLGTNIEIIPDSERATWRLTDPQLKECARVYSGRQPDDVFVKSPTPWGDLYTRYNWDQTHRTLWPMKAKILSIKSDPVIIATQEFINNSSVAATYNAGISQQVQETVSSTWSKTESLNVGQKITYKFKIAETVELGGETSFSFTHSWGEATTHSKTVTVASSSSIQVTLQPGQAVVASLQATRGSMDVQVDYTATIWGLAAVNYAKEYQGHHFHGYDIVGCLTAVGAPWYIPSTEVIKVGFYSDGQIRLSDKKSKRLLRVEKADILRI